MQVSISFCWSVFLLSFTLFIEFYSFYFWCHSGQVLLFSWSGCGVYFKVLSLRSYYALVNWCPLVSPRSIKRNCFSLFNKVGDFMGYFSTKQMSVSVSRNVVSVNAEQFKYAESTEVRNTKSNIWKISIIEECIL